MPSGVIPADLAELSVALPMLSTRFNCTCCSKENRPRWDRAPQRVASERPLHTSELVGVLQEIGHKSCNIVVCQINDPQLRETIVVQIRDLAGNHVSCQIQRENVEWDVVPKSHFFSLPRNNHRKNKDRARLWKLTHLGSPIYDFSRAGATASATDVSLRLELCLRCCLH